LIARAKQDEAGSGPVGAGLARAFLSTFALTITNPATILSFGAAFAVLGVGIGAGYLRPAVVVAGVLLGSATWWLVLATGAAALRARVEPALVRAISGLSGLAILAFGLVAVALALTGR
jgi:threonine/homoserine/homoserine lactone efflux protein